MPEVGGGHVMRCISIGRELNKYQSVHFLLCKGGNCWIDRIKYYGMTASVYESPIEIKNKKLLVDGYIFSNAEIQMWREKCKYMVFIDDNNMNTSSVDLVVSTRMDIPKSSCRKQTIIQGSEYALIAPEYARGIPSYSATDVRNILVSCGLQDSNNYVSKILSALSESNFDGNVNVAIGSQAPNLQKLLHSVNNYHFSVSVTLDSNGLYDLLMQSDIVIGTGGVSLLERMAIGRPSVTIIAAENQRNQAEWSEKVGATVLVDPIKQQFQHDLRGAIDLLLKSGEKRLEMSVNGSSFIDGRGSERVARCMSLGKC
jgi:spore coat polysaccharide biosynthesis predicted glycosyltransferase SpsG